MPTALKVLRRSWTRSRGALRKNAELALVGQAKQIAAVLTVEGLIIVFSVLCLYNGLLTFRAGKLKLLDIIFFS